MSAALVLLSGGQDSTTALFWAERLFDEVHAVTISYGQRHVSEVAAAVDIARLARVKFHTTLTLDALSDIGGSALVDRTMPLIGAGGYVDQVMPQGLPTSFVPGRNLLFLSLAASLAVKLGVRDVVTGVCQTDYSGYPDCREEFIESLEKTINLAMPSSHPVRLHAPLMHMTKAETVRLAHRLGARCWAALAHSITCYEGRRPGCGTCPSCELRAKGFKEAGYDDPSA